MPFTEQDIARLAEENASLRKQIVETTTQHERALRQRDDTHAKDVTAREEALAKRDTRIRDLVSGTVREQAIRAGARDESLDELAVILAESIGYDENMQAFVKGDDGQPLLRQGKPVEIADHVRAYLEAHPHHRKPAGGQGGGARGGASFVGARGNPASDVDAVKARIESEGVSAQAIDDLYQATRRRA